MIKGSMAFQFILIVFILMSCVNKKKEKDNISNVESVISQSVDSIKRNRPDSNSELIAILKEYKSNYRDTFRFDTSFIFNKKNIGISFKHFCLFDSIIDVPGKYVSIYGLDRFQTHNFESQLRLMSDNDTIINTRIKKESFDAMLFEALKEYGVLQYPNLIFKNNSFSIEYSISIPLTDIGKSCVFICDYNGKTSVLSE